MTKVYMENKNTPLANSLKPMEYKISVLLNNFSAKLTKLTEKACI
jgi:hypothetical protein